MWFIAAWRYWVSYITLVTLIDEIWVPSLVSVLSVLSYFVSLCFRTRQLGEPDQGRPWWRSPGRDPSEPGATERYREDQPAVSSHWSQVTMSFNPENELIPRQRSWSDSSGRGFTVVYLMCRFKKRLKRSRLSGAETWRRYRCLWAEILSPSPRRPPHSPPESHCHYRTARCPICASHAAVSL